MLGDDVELLRRDYRPRLLAYLTNQDEGGRRSAYELGRQAPTHGVGLLVLVRVHNEVFLEVIATARTADAAEQVARAASSFLFEALSSFEMTQRAFSERSGPDNG